MLEPPAVLKTWIDALPNDVQPFFNSGGWLIAVGVAALIVLLVLKRLLRGLLGGFRRAADDDAELTEDLTAYPPPPSLPGEPRLSVYGLPARLRLMVLAPLGSEAGELHPDDCPRVLNLVVPGIVDIARLDQTRIRVWPSQLSYQGFTAAFRRHTLVPGERGASRWVLLMGRVLVGQRPLALGMALHARQETTVGKVVFDYPHQWLEALRISGP